jgi:hypothetical protein
MLSQTKHEVKQKEVELLIWVPNRECRDSSPDEHIEQAQKKTSFDAIHATGAAELVLTDTSVDRLSAVGKRLGHRQMTRPRTADSSLRSE